MRRITDVPRIRRLKRDAHKGDRGRVLVVAGSITMSGAARLAGWGALRGGAGLVHVATPRDVQPLVAAELPCALTLPLPSRRGVFAAAGGAQVSEFATGVDAVAVGPGLTTSVATFLRRLLNGLAVPVVLDADALNLVAADPTLLDPVKGPRVLTPHPGEAARLLGEPVDGSDKARVKAAAVLADRFDAVVALKGAGTVVCDGDRYYVNRTGNPGLASGGAGDVLTGLIAARLAQGVDPLRATIQSVWCHGRAGDLAAAAVGEHSLIATDVVANLAAAVSELTETAPKRATKSEKARGSRRRGGRAR